MKPASFYFTSISQPRENENKMISSASSEIVLLINDIAVDFLEKGSLQCFVLLHFCGEVTWGQRSCLPQLQLAADSWHPSPPCGLYSCLLQHKCRSRLFKKLCPTPAEINPTEQTHLFTRLPREAIQTSFTLLTDNREEDGKWNQRDR